MHAVREARELELKYLRDLGVYEKVDENQAVEEYHLRGNDYRFDLCRFYFSRINLKTVKFVT